MKDLYTCIICALLSIGTVSAMNEVAELNERLISLLTQGDDANQAQVMSLLEQKASVSVKDKRGRSPLHLACLNSGPEVVHALLVYGADINERHRYGYSPLHGAAIGGNAEAVQVLLDHHADVNAVDAQNGTPLHFAVKGGYLEVVNILLAHKASSALIDNTNLTPLQCAYRNQRGLPRDHMRRIIEMLRASQLLHEKEMVERLNNDLFVLLHETSVHEDTSVPLVLLLERGAQVNARYVGPGTNEKTPLHRAAFNNNVPAIRILVDWQADVNAVDRCRATPLQWAVFHQKYQAAEALISYGAVIKKVEDNGDMIFPFIARHGQLALCRRMVLNSFFIPLFSSEQALEACSRILNAHWCLRQLGISRNLRYYIFSMEASIVEDLVLAAYSFLTYGLERNCVVESMRSIPVYVESIVINRVFVFTRKCLASLVKDSLKLPDLDQEKQFFFKIGITEESFGDMLLEKIVQTYRGRKSF